MAKGSKGWTELGRSKHCYPLSLQCDDGKGLLWEAWCTIGLFGRAQDLADLFHSPVKVNIEAIEISFTLAAKPSRAIGPLLSSWTSWNAILVTMELQIAAFVISARQGRNPTTMLIFPRKPCKKSVMMFLHHGLHLGALPSMFPKTNHYCQN